MADAITEERYLKLVDLAVERIREAERCAEAGCYPAACAMAGAGTEEERVARVCVCAAEVRAAGRPPVGGRWRKSRSALFDWSLEPLIQIALAMGWLPATRRSGPAEQAVEKLAGEVGDAVRFVQYARNLVVHPGKHVLETPWLAALGKDEYAVVYGVTRRILDHLHAALTSRDGRS